MPTLLSIITKQLFGSIQTAYAQAFIDPCPIDGLSCQSDIGSYVDNTIVPGLRIAFMGVLFAMLTYYAMKMIISSFNENTVKESRFAYMYAFIGTVIVLTASILAGSFVTFDTVDTDPTRSVLDTISGILRALVGLAFVVNVTVQAIRLIVGTEDSAKETAKKNFVFGIFGTFFVVLADVIVQVFFDADATPIMVELEGIIRFLATLFGTLCTVGIIISGFFLVISVGEAMKERAKKLMLATVVSLIIVIASWGLVSVFIF